MNKREHVFTSESVTEGHPDKMSDQVSDALLDAYLEQDPNSRVAIETLLKTGMCIVAGEVTTSATVDIPKIVRNVINSIGFNNSDTGFDGSTCAIMVAIEEQSHDISLGVTSGEGLHKEQGAGDQGLMFGYACEDTEELMPAAIAFSHRLTRQLAQVRKDGTLPYLRPDGKSQVSVRYVDGCPVHIDAVVISTQHNLEVSHDQIVEDMLAHVISPVLPSDLLTSHTVYHVNPTGRFVTGGPMGDAGLTGRKIIVDTYGGAGRHGGGAFSGKDPSKVDRSAAYMARHIAKNVVASGLASECEVQLAYAIGVAEPVSVLVDCFGTNTAPEDSIEKAIVSTFPLTPAGIIDYLKLKTPCYLDTACYGHFGRTGSRFTWENTNAVDDLLGNVSNNS
jgi:S-adenosylmethionine synthetase